MPTAQKWTITRRRLVQGLMATALLPSMSANIRAQIDPLASWNDGSAKQSILEFVSRVTTPGSPDFVPIPERIATFDNDGTLWAEKPFYFQLAFTVDRVKALSPQHPEWKTQQPFKSILEGDVDSVLAHDGKKALLEVLEVTHSNITTEDFADLVRDWIKTARHPRFDCLYTDLVYVPMLELLAYLRENGFKTFIVSGGGIEFMRAWVEGIYGIPPEHVVGSSGVTTFRFPSNGKPELLMEPQIDFVDEGPGKPVGINRFIGRRPILAFGNSDGDQQMLEWTAARDGASFMALIHHTDAQREWAYDRDSLVGRLDRALDEARARGWLVVDMARDWKRVFSFDH